MNCIITGGCGFIGVNLVKRLINVPDVKIKIIDDLSVCSDNLLKKVCDYKIYKSSKDHFSDTVTLFTVDILSKKVYNICKDADVIIHMAALPGVRESVLFPKLWYKNNVEGTFNILNAAKCNKVDKFIAASSGSCLGEITTCADESMPVHPLSPYAATKVFLEAILESYHHSYGMNTVSLRFSNVYGPYSLHKNSLIAKYIKDSLLKDIFTVYGDGNQTRDFIYVDDVVDVILNLLKLDKLLGIPYHVCYGHVYSVRAVISSLNDILTSNGLSTPSCNYANPLKGDSFTNQATNKKISELLKWSPKVCLEDGLLKTFDWFSNELER